MAIKGLYDTLTINVFFFCRLDKQPAKLALAQKIELNQKFKFVTPAPLTFRPIKLASPVWDLHHCQPIAAFAWLRFFAVAETAGGTRLTALLKIYVKKLLCGRIAPRVPSRQRAVKVKRLSTSEA